MAAQHEHILKGLNVITIGATPLRITNLVTNPLLAKAKKARSLKIQSYPGNKGFIFISDSEANATTNLKIFLDVGSSEVIIPDDWGDLKGHIDASKIWIHGDKVNDLAIIHFLDLTEGFL